MIIQAELKCKQTGCEANPCAVDKVIELPSLRFQQFSRALLADYDFIAENKNAIRHDDDSRHCLLILDAEGKDGFLVDPQGHNYARYSAFVPNARSLLTPDSGPCPHMRTAMPAVRIFLFLPRSSVFEKWFYQIFQKRRAKNVL